MIKFRLRNSETNEIIGYERLTKGGPWWRADSLRMLSWRVSTGGELGLFGEGRTQPNIVRDRFIRFDKKDNEMYEGDIVRYCMHETSLLDTGEVWHDNDRNVFAVFSGKYIACDLPPNENCSILEATPPAVVLGDIETSRFDAEGYPVK